MPNIKSAKKRVLVAKLRTEANKAAKTRLRTILKKARAEEADAAAIIIEFLIIIGATIVAEQ